MKYISVILLFTSLMISACLDPFTFESDPEDAGKLIINGQLNDSGEKQVVTLGLTQSFGLKAFEGVPGATLEICDDTGQCEILFEESQGVYSSLLASMNIVSGKSYHINITLSNGASYTSQPQEMPIKIEADSAYFEIKKETVFSEFGNESTQTVLDIFLDTKFDKSNGAPMFRWDFDELYLFDEITCGPLHFPKTCYVPLLDESQGVLAINTAQIEGNTLNKLLIHRRRSFPLIHYRNRHYFNVAQYTLGAEAFEYWSRVKSVSEQAGTVFDQPPATIPGNVYNVNDEKEVLLGFFEVAAKDIKRTYVPPATFKSKVNPRRTCSQFTGTFGPECCDCFELEEASITRPAWVK